jgi:hypothetical protein
MEATQQQTAIDRINQKSRTRHQYIYNGIYRNGKKTWHYYDKRACAKIKKTGNRSRDVARLRNTDVKYDY